MPETRNAPCYLAVLWIDWYAYHVARFRGLLSVPELAGQTVGIEMVGGVGVHTGLKFREPLPQELPIETLLPEGNWQTAGKAKLSLAVWRALSRLQPQVVLVPGYYTLPAIAAAVWAKVFRRCSVLMTESASYDHVRSAGKEWVKGAMLRLLFDWAVSGGKDHVAYLHQLGFPADRIAGCYDVVDNAMFQQGVGELRRASSAPQGLPTRFFLFVGRLSPEKNVALLLQAWLDYRDAGGTWGLVLAGDGPDRATLQQTESQTAHGRDVVFTGLKSSGELLPYYAFASCFVLPSTREPWGLVVNEALASGLPVLVSTHCGCARDLVVPGCNGFTFEPNDSSTLTALLHRTEALPDNERTAMGLRGQELIQKYSPEKFGHEVARIARTSRSNAALQTQEQSQ